METWLQDLRYAFRTIRRQPGVALTALITLALGIGATTAIFSVVHTVVLRPLPFTEPDRIVALATLWTKTGVRGPVSAPDFHDWREQGRSFEALAYYQGGETAVSVNGSADYAAVFRATAGFFQALGVRPRLGRLLSSDEERAGGPLAAVITDAFWRRQFGAEPRAVGADLKVGVRTYTIVGVLPPGARFPARADVYLAASTFPENPNRGGHNYFVVGRLQPGVTVEQAQSEMTAIAGRLAQQYPGSNADKSVAVASLQDAIVGNARLTLFVLLSAVSFVLLIACANVANLLLARAIARTREMVVRAAIGARRQRLLRQLLTESAVMGLLAGVGGIALANVGVRTLIAVAPENLPRLDEVAVSPTALGFAVGVSLMASFVFGLAPAWRLSRVQFAEGLRQGGTGAVGGAPRDWTRSAFVVAEVAFAVVLVTGAVLLGRSLVALAEVDLGFDTERVLALRTSVPFGRGEIQQAPRFYRDVLPEIRTIPGVIAAGAVWGLPTRSGSISSYAIEGSATPELRLDGPSAILTVVTPEYFRAMSIPLVQGRDFSDGDRIDAPFVAVVNEALVRRSFPDQSPLGHRIRNGLDSPELMTIVGVVKDVRTHGPEQPVAPEIYMPFEQHPGPASAMTIVARTGAVDPRPVAPAIIARIRAQNPDVPIRLDTLEEVISTATATPRFRTYILGVFAIVALLLATAGVSAVVAFSVSQRAREIGLRVALGATPRDILGLVVRHGGWLTAVGIAAGVALSLALARLMSGLLFEVTARDPIALITVVAAVGTAALAACYVPALLALRITPMMALRTE